MEKTQPKPLTDYPKGWFAVAYSEDLKPGQVMKRRLFGREMVLFRTKSGKAALVDAYCPHLGAHLGHGGTVEGEAIRCPFHGFCFDSEGACVSIPYGSKCPPKTNLNNWVLEERCGFLFTHFDPSEKTVCHSPAWQLPELDERSYTKVKGSCTTMRGHPQEILENSVDFGHLTELHGFDFPPIETDVTAHGHVLKVVAAIERPGNLFARKRVRAEYSTFIHGLGVSYVDVQISAQNLQFRLFGMVTPVDIGMVELRLAVQLKHIDKVRNIHPLLALFPKRWIESFILNQAYKAYYKDVSKDFPVWENKVYITPPGLAKGDGPISKYRRWASQFY